jgi:hypothetical protein
MFMWRRGVAQCAKSLPLRSRRQRREHDNVDIDCQPINLLNVRVFKTRYECLVALELPRSATSATADGV